MMPSLVKLTGALVQFASRALTPILPLVTQVATQMAGRSAPH